MYHANSIDFCPEVVIHELGQNYSIILMTSLYHVSDSMSLDLNKVQLIGRSTATVTTKLIEPSNIAVVNFTVVTNRKYKNAQ